MQPKCDNSINLGNEYDRRDVLCDALIGHSAICIRSIDDLHQAIGQASNEILQSNLPIEQKRAMVYDFLVCTYRTIIGYNLTLDGAIVIAREVLTSFQNEKAIDEHRREKKIDHFKSIHE